MRRRYCADTVPMILARHDGQTPCAGQLAACERAREPKSLLILDCRHHAPRATASGATTAAARDGSVTHLAP